MENIKQNKMAVMPVNRLMLSMGIPMVLSMVLQALYNIVDSAFVANMAVGGEEALNALALAFPMQMLMVAISIGTGVGANALMSKSLGQGNAEKASRAAGNSIFMAILISIAFLFLAYLVLNSISNHKLPMQLSRIWQSAICVSAVSCPLVLCFSLSTKNCCRQEGTPDIRRLHKSSVQLLILFLTLL